MSKLRDVLAESLRTIPHFRGKSRLGDALGFVLNNPRSYDDSIRTIKMRDGSLMRLDVRSRSEKWAFWTGEYDYRIIARLASCLCNDCTVFDVGANVGFYTIALGNRLKHIRGKIHAFEPVVNNFSRLVHCVSLNDLDEVVFPHNVAIGDEEGVIELRMEQENGASTGNAVILRGKLLTENNQDATSTAPITKLDTFVEEHQIRDCRLIKIDVEGAEVMFLRGGAGFLSMTRPIIYANLVHII